MMRRALRNAENGELTGSVSIARGPVGRAIGLLLTKSLLPGEGMWFEPCAAIHTLGMRYAIDVVFLDLYGTVIQTIENVMPNRAAITCLKARVTVEFGAGTLACVRAERGDRLYLAEALPSRESKRSTPG